MKKHLQLLLLFISFHTYAQHSDFEKVSTHNKWKVDVETMKPNMLKSISLKTEMEYLTPEEREQAIKSIFIAFEMMGYQFTSDGNCTITIGSTEIKGKYITKENSKILELNFESGEIELYKIVSFDKNKIHLYSDARKNDLVLIPAK